MVKRIIRDFIIVSDWYVGVDRLTKIAHFGAMNMADILGHDEEKEEENPTMKPPLTGAQDTRGEILS